MMRPSAHPRTDRAAELALATVAIAAAGNGVGFRDLIAAGFSPAEIAEHATVAERIVEGARHG